MSEMKYIIIIVILAIVIGFGIQQVYSESTTITCQKGTETIIECLIYGIYKTQIEIIKQNLQIIEKLDWNNCVVLSSSHYSGKSIPERCGEIP